MRSPNENETNKRDLQVHVETITIFRYVFSKFKSLQARYQSLYYLGSQNRETAYSDELMMGWLFLYPKCMINKYKQHNNNLVLY